MLTNQNTTSAELPHDSPPQLIVVAACLGHERCAGCARLPLERGLEECLQQVPGVGGEFAHEIYPEAISLCSHARAKCHSSLTVVGERPSACAVSWMVKPAKNRNETISPFR